MLQLDMEMPKSCVDCPICYDFILCPLTDTHVNFDTMDKERLPNCPLKSVNEVTVVTDRDTQILNQSSFINIQSFSTIQALVKEGVFFEDIVTLYKIPEDQATIIQKYLDKENT